MDYTRETVNESMLRAVYDHSPAGMLVVDSNDTIRYGNPAAHILLGYDKNALVNLRLSTVTTDFSASSGACTNSVHNFRHRSGELIPFTCLVYPLREEAGDTVVQFLSASPSGRNASLSQQSVWNDLFAYFGCLSPDGDVTDINDSAVQASGMSKSEIIGKRFSSFSWWTHSGETHQRMIRALNDAKAGRTARFDTSARVAGDRLLHIDLMMMPIASRDSAIKEIIVFGVDVTARKQVEDALYESNKRLDLIFNNTADALMLLRVDDAQKFIAEAVNCSYISLMNKLFDHAGVNTIGKDLDATLHEYQLQEDVVRQVLNNCQLAVSQKKPVQYESEIFGVNGIHFLEGNLVPIVNDTGICTHLLWSNREITERKKRDETLRVSEERLRLALYASNQGIYDYDVGSGRVEVSEGYASMLGYEYENFHETVHHWKARLHPDDRERVVSHLEDYLSGRKDKYQTEFRLRTRAGNWKWISSVGEIVRWNSDSAPSRMLGTHTDITERKIVEERLQKKNKELKEIIDALDESSLVSITDPQGTILKVNKQFCKVAGYKEEELVGRNHRVINSGYHSKEFWYKFWQTLSRGEVWKGEIKNRTKAGEEYWVSTVINPIRDERGNVSHMLSIRNDITNRKKIETLLLESNQRLARIEQFINLTTDAISVGDEDGNLVYLNKAASERLGIPQEHCLQFNVVNLDELFGGDITKWKQHVAMLKKGGPFFSEVLLINQKTRRRIPAEVNMRHVCVGDIGYVIAIIRDISERKKSEIALRESEARLAEAQRLARLGYWELNLNNGALWWSPEQYEMNGYPPSFRPTQESFMNQLHPHDRDIVRRTVFRVISSGEAESVTYRIIRPDGEVRVIQGKARLIKNDRGEPVKINGINQDISEMVAAEKALRISEQSLRHAQRVAKIGSWKLDVTNDILEWSDEVYRIFERERDNKTITTKLFFSYIHPEDKAFVQTKWAEALQGRPYDVIHRIVAENTVKWVREQAEFTFDEEKNLVFAFGTVQDITDHQTLREANHIFNQSQLLTGFGSWRWTMRNNDFFWSDNIYLLHGLDKASVKPSLKALLNAIHKSDRKKLRRLFDQRESGSPPFSVEYRVVREDAEKWLLSKGNVVHDAEGNVLEIYGVVRDITAEKLNTDELIKARQEAEEANLIKDEFLSVMSHEIRTPLNSVIGLANLLLKRSPRPDQLNIMKTLKGSADNLLHLVNDILDFNKIRAGKLELELIDFSVPKFLHQLFNAFQLTAQDKGLDFSVHSDAQIPDVVTGDVTRLNQVMNNLVSNAIKFTESGYVKLLVDLKSENTGRCTLLFRVEDSGLGIAPNKLHSIFEPFQQSDNDITRKYGGTGLGLSIVRALVEIMKGDITVASTPGKGSVFTVELTFMKGIKKQELRKFLYATPRGSQIPQLRPAGRRINVLYIEDVESNRFLIENLLSDSAIECTAVSSGKEALARTLATRFDLILMDLQMPIMDGYLTTKRIQNQRRGKNNTTPVLAFTAEPSTEDLRKRVHDHGIKDLITKPFDTDYLLEKIRTFALETPAENVFSFRFYADAFDNDPLKLKKIGRSIVTDVARFEKKLVQAFEQKNSEKMRSELHRMRPIFKNLSCTTVLTLIDKINHDTFDATQRTVVHELQTHLKYLLNDLKRLE
jgi:PAS domain S-box-containing protein